MKTWSLKLSEFDWQHWLIVLGSGPLGGAAMTYLESQSADGIIAAFSSKIAFASFLRGFLLSELVALIALAKQKAAPKPTT